MFTELITAMLRNPDVLNARNITTTGNIILGYRKGDGGKITDFGLIESVDRNRETQKRTFKGNRKGKTKTYKEVIDESTFSMTFQTGSTGDAAIREWHVGKKAIITPPAAQAFAATHDYAANDMVLEGGRIYRVMVAGKSGAAAPVWPTGEGEAVGSGTATFVDAGTLADNSIQAFSEDASITSGGFVLVQTNEESDNTLSVIRVFPNGNVEGNGEPKIQDFDGFQFLFTATGNLGFQPPVEFGDFAQARPDGYVYIVPTWRTEAVLKALLDALIAYIDQ